MTKIIIEVVIIIISLLLSSLFSGSEIVYSKVNVNRLERKGTKKSLRAIKIVENFENTITTILIGNNLVNVLMSSIAAILALDLAKITHLSEDEMSLIMTIAITIIVLIFGEILPKTFFSSYTFELSLALTNFMSFCIFLLKPIANFFEVLVNGLVKLFYKKEEVSLVEQEEDLTEELMNMAEDLEEKGVIDEDEAELLKSAIDLTDKTAWEIMVPRVDVTAYDIEDSLSELVNDENFFVNSRVLIYEETIDHIKGILNTTEVLKALLNNEDINIEDYLYEPLYVHKTMPIANVLSELKKEHKHLAIVLDEWGGTYGIITIEDILEELFGDIWDETDEIELEYEKISDTEYIVDADMGLSDFFDLVEFDDRELETNYSTIGGLFTELLDELPEVKDAIDFENYHLEVVETDELRLKKIKVTINPILDDEE